MTQFVKAVLFDLDGTLIDTAADFVRIIKRMSEQHGWQAPDDSAIREQVSAGASAMVKLILSHNQQPISDEVLQSYRQQFLDEYEADICVDSSVFDQLDSVLSTLEGHGTPWGIVTNKPRYLAEKLLAALDLTERCTVLVCPDDVRHTKPDPEPMYLALEKLGLPRGIASTVIYVGDHLRDIESGNAAGMITVLASYGYIPPEDQANLSDWGADFIVDSPAALAALLKSAQFDYL
ncbi:HAD family hydrolase [Psychrobacter pygoscelis]|uniref:HAD family hydrolase n=1 Tax=Psychrobacter pygoscelis TaxID=2488563 RepID=UPI0013F3D4BF|nr:HAD-IA family hydrolase [Psychrobacter pygoscelis]